MVAGLRDTADTGGGGGARRGSGTGHLDMDTVDTLDSCSKTLIFCNTTQSHTAAGKEVDMSKATLAAGCKSYYWVSAAIAQSSNCGSFETSPPVTITTITTITSLSSIIKYFVLA